MPPSVLNLPFSENSVYKSTTEKKNEGGSVGVPPPCQAPLVAGGGLRTVAIADANLSMIPDGGVDV